MKKQMKKWIAFILCLVMLCGAAPLGGFVGLLPVKAEAADGVPEGYIGVYNIEDLYMIRNDLAANYILMRDIDLTADLADGGDWNEGMGWTPIGIRATGCDPFTGVFDGNGHTLKGFQIKLERINSGYPSEYYVGLFGINSGTISNLNFSDCSVTAVDNSGNICKDNYLGAVCGKNDGGVVRNCSVKGRFSYGESSNNISRKYSIGRICGYNTGEVSCCTAEGSIIYSVCDGKWTYGGIVGYNAGGSVFGCMSQGKSSAIVSYQNGNGSPSTIAYNSFGGIVGLSDQGSISQCGNCMSISVSVSDAYRSVYSNYHGTTTYGVIGSAGIGGILGSAYSTTITDCYNSAELEGSAKDVIGAYGTTSSNYSHIWLGGILGYSNHSDGNISIANVYNAGNVAGAVSSQGKKCCGCIFGGGKANPLINNAYYIKSSDYIGVGQGADTCMQKTSTILTKRAAYTGFDFNNVWTMNPCSSYKYAQLQANPQDAGADYHTCANPIAYSAPTYEEDGFIHGICDVCGEEFSKVLPSASGVVDISTMIEFGSYPQNRVSDSSIIRALEATGKAEAVYNGISYWKFGYWYEYAPLEWRVLAYDNSHILLLCDKVLDCQAYHSSSTAVTWDNASLNGWLNGEFKRLAFNTDEQAIIGSGYGLSGVSMLTVDDLINPDYGFDPDPIVDDPARQAKATDVAEDKYQNGVSSLGYVCYLARETSAVTQVHYVLSDDVNGCIGTCHATTSITDPYKGVRPAICLNRTSSEYAAAFIVDDAIYSSAHYAAGDSIAVPADPQKEGYTFVGWADSSGHPAEVPATMPAKNLTFVAVWEEAAGARISLSSATGVPGQTVQLIAGISDNPGISSANVGFNYDTDKLLLTNVALADGIPSSVFRFNKKVIWIADDNLTADGDFLILTFEILADAVPGEVPVEITCPLGSVSNENGDDVQMASLQGSVTIIEPQKYQAIFMSDASTVASNEYLPGETIVIPDSPEKEGYTFTGWDPAVPDVMPAEDLIFNATFAKQAFTVTYLVDGTPMEQIPCAFGEPVPIRAVPEKEGYTAVGWTPAVPATMPAADLTFNAVYAINSYTLRFMDDETELLNQTKAYGSQIVPPAAPEKENLSFLGWSLTAGDAASIVNPAAMTMPAANLDLYAIFAHVEATFSVETYLMNTDGTYPQQPAFTETCPGNAGETVNRSGVSYNGFTLDLSQSNATGVIAADGSLTLQLYFARNQYTLTIDMNDGSAPTETKYYFGAVLPSISNPVRAHYEFSCWKDAAGNAVSLPATMPQNDVTVIAQWNRTDYTVTWVADETSTVEYYAPGAMIQQPADPTKEGHLFIGWDADIPASMPSEDLCFTAQWVKTYTIEFIVDGAVYYSANYPAGISIAKPADPVKEGYSFSGWDATVPKTMPAYDMTLTAVFEEEFCQLIFDANGGAFTDGTGMIIRSMNPGSPISIPADPTREGHIFNGWSPEVPAYMPAGKQVFVASWTPISYKVSWTNIDAPFSFNVRFGAEIPVPENISRTGYHFTGWSPAVPATMPAQDMEFSANWEVNTHTVTWIVDETATQTTVLFGAAIPLPATPEKEDLSFIGWTPSVPVVMPDEDLTFTAIFGIDYGLSLALENDNPIYAGDKRQVILDIDPAPRPDTEIVWSSGNESIFTVDQNGKLTAVSCGTAEVIVTVDQIKTARLAVTVNHRYLKITHAADCLNDGWELYNCTVCHDTYTVITEKATGAHAYEPTVFAPTCSKPGCTLNICTRCGRVYKSDVTAPLGHNFEEWKVIRYATEDHEGLEQRQCQNDDCGYTEDRLIPRLDQTTYTVTFVADGETVAVVEYAKGATSVREPAVPHKDRFEGRWEAYTLNNQNVVVHAVYTLIDLNNLSGITADKTATYNAETGEATIRMTASSAGKTIISQSAEKVPLDIVLVVDQSGSMQKTLGGSTTKQAALKAAATQFVQSVYNDASANSVDHRIAIVGFAMGTKSARDGAGTMYYAYENTEILTTGSNPIQMNQATNATYAAALMQVNAGNALNANLTRAINNIDAKGATAADLGLSMATKVFANGNDAEGRQRIVVFMTDGTPTYQSDFSTDVANAAIQNAEQLKETYGATVYSVGVMSDAEANNPQLAGFMQSVSSNATAEDPYYLQVNNTNALTGIFTEIVTEHITRTAEFDDVTLIDTISPYFTLTTQQENALRQAVIAAYGVENDDITVTRNDDGTTTVQIAHLHPVDDGTQFKVDVSFTVSANENAAEAGTYPTNTADAGVIIGDNENYEATFAIPSVTVPTARRTVVFNLNDQPYLVQSKAPGQTVTAPVADFGEDGVFSGWNVDANAVAAQDLTEFNATFASDTYAVIWNIDGERSFDYYIPGDTITPPTVGPNGEGQAFRRWNTEVPTVMPAETLEFTAVYGDHEHQYTATVVTPMTCLEDGLIRYTCDVCSESYTETVKAPGTHSWKAITGPADGETSGVESFKCEACGAVDSYGLEYKLNSAENGALSQEFNYYDASGNAAQPKEMLTITAAVGEHFNNVEDVIVYRIGENDERIPCNSDYANGVSTFETDHFSTYEFVPVYHCQIAENHPDANSDNVCDVCGQQVRATYTVRWLVNGAAISEATYFAGDVITVPANPTQTGKTFKGWSPRVPAKMPAKDLDFVATWNTNAHTHVPFTAGAYDATCTAQGYTGDTYCQTCGEQLATGEATPALGHHFESHVSYRNGKRTVTSTCTRCGVVSQQSSTENGKRILTLQQLLEQIFNRLFEVFFKTPFISRKK